MNTQHVDEIELTPAEIVAWMRMEQRRHCARCKTELTTPRTIRVGIIAAQCPNCLKHVIVVPVEDNENV